MSSLQEDFILTKILPWLPGKSLMRFKCVSKSFNSVMSSPDFPLEYLRYRTLPSPDLLILPGNRGITCYDLDSSTATASFYWPDNVYVELVGSSNGLLCIFNYVTACYCVINPTTLISQYIPYPKIVTYGPTEFGFAFDPNNLDFKIVEVCYQANKRTDTRVYSLNTNSWTIVQPNLPVDGQRTSHGCGTLINNHLLHWIFWSESLKKSKIDCFDVCKNEWVADVLLPHFYYDTTHEIHHAKIGALYGSLFASFHNRGECCFDVWVMEVYGVQYSWFKLLSIPVSIDFGDVVLPVACRGGFTEVLIRQRFKAKFFWYNRNNGELSEAKFVEAPNILGDQACICSRSIVDLPDGTLFVDP